MSENGEWRAESDPNARTQVSAVPRQRDLEAGADPAPGALPPDTGGGRGPGRRRVLFAAGGMMLLIGGGAAAAVSADRRLLRNANAAQRIATASRAPGPARPVATASATATRPTPEATASPAASSLSPSTRVAKAPQWYVDDDGSRAIALTMDDGPHPVYTPQVLEIFREYGITATFNMIGRQIGANLPLVREVSAEGHTITNHTWDHADLTRFTVAQVLSEIDRCNDALAEADQYPTIFRAPYGNWSTAVYRACALRGLTPVGWSVDPRDWDTAHVDTQQIVANVLANTRAHDIILEHDGGGDRSNTVAALRIFIPELLERGFRFVAM